LIAICKWIYFGCGAANLLIAIYGQKSIMKFLLFLSAIMDLKNIRFSEF